jgi:hypothetical protein
VEECSKISRAPLHRTSKISPLALPKKKRDLDTMMSNELTDSPTPSWLSNEPTGTFPISPRSKRESQKNKLLAAAKTVKKAAGKVGQTLQKANMAKWIDDLEHDQEMADRMDRINADNRETQGHLDLKREAEEACFDAIQTHLDGFLEQRPLATYEEWIIDLHPENVSEKDGKQVLDHRFYVNDSDHRHLWNRHLRDRERNITRRYVATRSLLTPEGSFCSTDGLPTQSASSDSTF